MEKEIRHKFTREKKSVFLDFPQAIFKMFSLTERKKTLNMRISTGEICYRFVNFIGGLMFMRHNVIIQKWNKNYSFISSGK